MNVVEFLTAEALLAAVEDEATAPSRFPVRFILVSGLSAWQELLAALGATCAPVRLSAFCAGDDLLPQVADLRSRLHETPGDRLVVLPYGELLRLSPGLAPTTSLATWERVGRKRAYIPVLDAEDILREHLQGVARYRSGECSVWRIRGDGHVSVHVTPFAIKPSGKRVAHGVRAYLEMWEQAPTRGVLFVTSLAPYLQERYGLFQFTVSGTAHAALCSQVAGGDRLDKEWGSEEQWQWLASQARAGEPFDKLAGRLLNIVHYDATWLLSMWHQLSASQRWLAWIWARSLECTASFADIALHSASSPDDIVTAACVAPLHRELSLAQLKERRAALHQLDVREMPATFWTQLEAIPDALARLKALPGLSDQQREQIIRAVGQLLASDVPEETWLPYLEVSFPELAIYLAYFPYADADARAYMRVYTRSRVADKAHDALLELSGKWAEEKRVWRYPTRATALASIERPRAKVLWVDGLGVEWVGVLHALLNNEDVEATVTITRANLPTSTPYNKGWSEGAHVERELDKIAHDLDYAYPTALVRQLGWIRRFARDVCLQCQTQDLIAIASDHGLTRFASAGRKVPVPHGFAAHKWGRYATGISTTLIDIPESDDWVTEQGTLVLARHSLFEGGSMTHGEVHGGATLEESLVPVLLVCARSIPCPKAQLASREVRLDTRGQGQLLIQLDRPVQELRLAVGKHVFDAQRQQGNRWVVVLDGLQTGTHSGSLQYEKGAIGEVRFQTSRGVIEDDMGL